MREVIFRGKSIEDGQWVEGVYVEFQKGFAYIMKNFTDVVNIIPETVGQYTGMKDKNDNKIFEGDIVALNEDVKKIFNVDDGEVRYGWGGFYIKEFSTLNSLNTLASYDCILRGEVVGNIHDNPELLNT